MRFLFPLIFIIFGLWSLADSNKDEQTINRLKGHSEITVLEPIQQYTQHTTKRGFTTSTTYSADMVFKTKTGQAVTIPHHFVTLEEVNASQRAGVKIEYLPEDPQVFKFVDSTHESHLGKKESIGMILFGLLWLWWGNRSRNR